MNTTQIYFAGPSGDAVALSVQRKRASMPSHGMYRAEIDIRPLTTEQSTTDLLDLCLRSMKDADCLLVGVNASSKMSLDANILSRVAENKRSVIYRAKWLTRDALESLTSISYGEIFVIGCTDMEGLAELALTMTDIDAALTALGGNAYWTIGYEAESAVLTIIAREEGVVKGQVMSALDLALNDK